jgi:hypothetical protein
LSLSGSFFYSCTASGLKSLIGDFPSSAGLSADKLTKAPGRN